MAETLDAVVLSDLGVEADGEATRVAAERGVVAAVAHEGQHGERHAERPGAIRGHDLDLLLRETRVVRDLDHLAGLDMIRLLAGSERGAPLPASRHFERLHVGDDAGDGRLLRGVRHPGCPGAAKHSLKRAAQAILPEKPNPTDNPRITPAGCLEAPTLSTCTCAIAEAWF